MIEHLYHYYDEQTGPFCNLSELNPEEAEKVLHDIRTQQRGFASKRTKDYLQIRRGLEIRAREQFVQKGGKPIQYFPHYMTLGACPWLLDWYPNGRELQISMDELDSKILSFTYGDLFPTMRYVDEKPYRCQVYMLEEIRGLIDEYGYPQEWNPEGIKGPERYIEVQIWDDAPLKKWRDKTNPK
ncbi:hypothetical protein M3231_21990 [Neobacillus mesonae]|nr:hypothetical protein [Neobacillus mesonae]